MIDDRTSNKCCSWCGKQITKKQAIKFNGCCNNDCYTKQNKADTFFNFESLNKKFI